MDREEVLGLSNVEDCSVVTHQLLGLEEERIRIVSSPRVPCSVMDYWEVQ